MYQVCNNVQSLSDLHQLTSEVMNMSTRRMKSHMRSGENLRNYKESAIKLLLVHHHGTLNKALSIQGPGCILYATSDKTKGFLLGHDQSCSFVIYGEVVIVLLAIGLLLAAVIKAFMGRWLVS